MLFKNGAKALGAGGKAIKTSAKFGKLGLLAKKHAPTIMVVAGVALVIGGTIAACKQTLKVKEILDEASNDFDEINATANDPEKKDLYSPKDARNDRMILYAQTGVKLLKCYGPAILAIGAGLGLMLGAHKILSARNAALTVAYSNLLSNFKNYRGKVIDKLGEEEEKLLASGAEKMDISVENEDGTAEKVKDAMVVHDDGSKHSIYARVFDEYCDNWSKNPVSNLTFLRAQQNFANNKLIADGYLFLNDVYQMLGFPKTSEGQIVGWLYDPNKEVAGHIGDDYVDFGIYNALYKDAAKREFVNAAEPCVWLDFNVDGVIYDLI